MTLRIWLATRLHALEYWLVPAPAPPLQRGGKWLRFEADGRRFGEPHWCILSQRGDFLMGFIQWSPQWHAYSFVSVGDASSDIVRWNAGSLAEVYAFLKERGQASGRFV